MAEQPNTATLQNIWERRNLDINLPTDALLGRPFTPEDVDYLCNNKYPFLQIINTASNFGSEAEPKFIKLSNGWIIFDYGDAICSSYSTKYNFSKMKGADTKVVESKVKAEEEGGETGSGDAGSSTGGEGGGGVIIEGSVVWQQLETAFAMMQEAIAKGWPAAEIVDGSRLMRFYAWVAAKKLGMAVQGFYPSEEQEKRYEIMQKGKSVVSRRRRIAKVVEEIAEISLDKSK